MLICKGTRLLMCNWSNQPPAAQTTLESFGQHLSSSAPANTHAASSAIDATAQVATNGVPSSAQFFFVLPAGNQTQVMFNAAGAENEQREENAHPFVSGSPPTPMSSVLTPVGMYRMSDGSTQSSCDNQASGSCESACSSTHTFATGTQASSSESDRE